MHPHGSCGGCSGLVPGLFRCQLQRAVGMGVVWEAGWWGSLVGHMCLFHGSEKAHTAWVEAICFTVPNCVRGVVSCKLPLCVGVSGLTAAIAAPLFRPTNNQSRLLMMDDNN